MLKLKFHPMFIIVALMIMINISSAKQNDVSVRNSTVVAPLAAGTIESTFNASWTWANPIFQSEYRNGDYYYDVFEIVASTSGDYYFTSKAAVATVGYLYLPIFNASSPDRNIVEYDDWGGADGTFEFTHYLEAGIQYYLVATTYEFLEIGQYQVIITGKAEVTINRKTVLEPTMENIVIKSTLTHLLPQLATVCDSLSYESYDIYSVVAAANGTFFIETATESGMVIRLHSPSFDPLNTLLNVVAFDVSSKYNTRQLVNVILVGSVQYYLVLSKDHYEDEAYRLTFRGPSNFTIVKLTDQLISIVKTSTFSLTKKSPVYSQGYSGGAYYYKVFRITVQRVGIYTLLGYSDTSLRNDLYENSFSSMLPDENYIDDRGYSDGQAEFITKAKLTPDKDYYLVVTTEYEKVVADFNLTAVGPSPVTVAAVPDAVKSNVTLSSSLTLSTPKFRRCESDNSNFYYQLFNISVPSLGLYTLRTQGSMDTYGCMYINRFDPISSSSNLISYDGQSGRNDQFAITTILKTNTTYYLAATTSRRNVVGSFTLVVSGPAKATVRAVSTP